MAADSDEDALDWDDVGNQPWMGEALTSRALVTGVKVLCGVGLAWAGWQLAPAAGVGLGVVWAFLTVISTPPYGLTLRS